MSLVWWLLVAVTRTAGYVVLLLLSVYAAFRARKFRRGYRRGATPLPGPPAIPFLGNTLTFYRHRFATLPLFAQWVRRYGNTYRFTVLGDRDIILINDPESIKHVLSTKFRSGVYGKGAYQQEQYRDLIGMGIFNSNPPLWKEQRRCAAMLFTIDALKQHVSVFQRHARVLCTELLRIRSAGSSGESSYAQRGVDMQDYFLRFTLDAFAEIGFGYATGSILSPGPNRFGAAFDLVQSRCFKRMDYGAFWPWLAPPDRRFKEAVSYMDGVVRDCVAQCVARGRPSLLESHARAPDLLTHALLDMLNPDGTRNERYDESALRDTCLNFLIAGRDTTALMLSWFFFLLAQHPEVEERVVAELEEVFGHAAAAPAAAAAAAATAGDAAPAAAAAAAAAAASAAAAGQEGASDAAAAAAAAEGPLGDWSDAAAASASASVSASPAAAAAAPSPSSTPHVPGPSASPASSASGSESSDGSGVADLSFESLRRLTYLQNSLQESLRLYPSVPFNGFTALEDDTLPGGHFVPAGTYVTYSAFLLHRRPDLYPDPERFDPSRWERSPARPFRFVAFHGGPRECLGREMAMAEAKVLVATMMLPRALGGFGIRLRLHPRAEVQLKRAIILTARRGIHMQVHLADEDEALALGQGLDESGTSSPSASTSASATATVAHAVAGSGLANLDAMSAASSPSPSPSSPASAGDRWSEETLEATASS